METSTIEDLTLSVPVYLFYFIIFPIGISSQYILSISAKVNVQDKGFNKPRGQTHEVASGRKRKAFCTLLVAEFFIDSIAVGRVRWNTLVAVTSHE